MVHLAGKEQHPKALAFVEGFAWRKSHPTPDPEYAVPFSEPECPSQDVAVKGVPHWVHICN
jgi:hypothetical protein